MKITIELNAAEVQGIKNYLHDMEGGRITKADIQQFLQSEFGGYLHAQGNSLAWYIEEAENHG